MMENSKQTKQFHYWKYHWQSGVLLAAGILQLLALRMEIEEYQLISQHSDLLFTTASQLAEWRSRMTFGCFVSGVCAVLCIGIFLIGTFCSNAKAARRAEGSFLLAIALLCAAAGILFWLGQDARSALLCFLLAAAMLGAGFYSFFRKL